MTHAYDPEAWREVYLMLGGALAALAGLLFVAISVRIDVIGKAPHWRVRAFGNIFALIGLLIISALVMLPQEPFLLGIELILANLFLLFFVPIRSFLHISRSTPAEVPLLRLALGTIGWGLGVAAGASLIVRAGGGMYLLTISCLGLIWISILNAWSFVTVDAPTAD